MPKQPIPAHYGGGAHAQSGDPYIIWYSTQIYLPGGQGSSIRADRSKSASSPLAPALTDPHILQLWCDFLTSILSKPLMEADTGLDLREKLRKVDERNAWNWWRCHLGSAWIPRGDYEPLCLICLVLLSKYLLSKNKIFNDLEGMMVTSV